MRLWRAKLSFLVKEAVQISHTNVLSSLELDLVPIFFLLSDLLWLSSINFLFLVFIVLKTLSWSSCCERKEGKVWEENDRNNDVKEIIEEDNKQGVFFRINAINVRVMQLVEDILVNTDCLTCGNVDGTCEGFHYFRRGVL